MKTCSKCKKDLPRECFVKSNRYVDGLYPSCKECRKRTRLRTLLLHPLCSKCGRVPHTHNHAQCYDCQRENKQQSPNPKWRRDFQNRLCSRCKVEPRCKYHNYCLKCKRKAVNSWIKEQGGMWGYSINLGNRNRPLAHAAVARAIKSGKLTRNPCEQCGTVKTEAHHYMGYDRKYWLVVKWLCKSCHDLTHKIARSQLTEQPLLL